MEYIENKKYKGLHFQLQELARAEYENCTFIDCSFANTNLSGIIFSECLFSNCDLSLAIIGNTSFREVTFKSSKLLGLHFNKCNKFLLEMKFEDCILNFSSFYQVNLKKNVFKDCKLLEVDFVESNLYQAVFLNCDLAKAVFNRTLLEGTDFRTSYNFSIHPSTNKIKKAKFSRENVLGLLDSFQIVIE